MSSTTKTGGNYVWSYPGLLKIAEAIINITLITSATVITVTFRTNFLCGIAIYGLLSVIVLLGLNLTGFTKKSNLPWLWIEFFCSLNLVLLYTISSTLVLIEMTKGSIVTGILGYTALTVYLLDTLEHFKLARTPRSRYVWTTPNMPELS